MDIGTQHSHADQAYSDFIEQTKKELGSLKFKDSGGFLKQTSILEMLSVNYITAYLLFDATRNKIDFFSPNTEQMFGYSSEELQNLNLQLAFRTFHKEHLELPMTINEWRRNLHAEYTKSGRINPHWKSCSINGLKIRHKKGHYLTLSVRYVPLYPQPDGFSPLTLILLHDISPYFKSDFFWARATLGDQGEKIAHYHSVGPSSKSHDIISEREKDVLRLIASGKSSRQVADDLFIAQNTVDRHRKNMLARTGAKDTTALLHICRLCGVI